MRHRSPPRQRGIALILVLWVITLLTVIAGSFSYSMRTEALLARNQVNLGQSRALADGAVHRAIYESLRPRLLNAATDEAAKPWRKDGRVYSWRQGEATIAVSMLDESGKIDLNTASDALLKNFLRGVGGLDEQQAEQLLEAILDWRDTDDLRRPNGAEAAEYRAAGRNYTPANAPFDTVGDLQRVLGMTPALFAKLAPYLTVYSRQPGVNAASAERAVLLSLPGATPEAVDEYIARRDEARKNELPPPPFVPAAAFGAGDSGATRIRAEASMNGLRFVREAVYRPGDQRRVAFLYWAEGTYQGTSMVTTTNGNETNS